MFYTICLFSLKKKNLYPLKDKLRFQKKKIIGCRFLNNWGNVLQEFEMHIQCRERAKYSRWKELPHGGKQALWHIAFLHTFHHLNDLYNQGVKRVSPPFLWGIHKATEQTFRIFVSRGNNNYLGPWGSRNWARNFPPPL